MLFKTAINYIVSGMSPMEAWAKFNDEQKLELYIFHFIYLMIKSDYDNTMNFLDCTIEFNHQIKEIGYDIWSWGWDGSPDFYDIFQDRLANYEIEIAKIRETQCSGKGSIHYPNYFYNRIFTIPLVINYDVSSLHRFKLDGVDDHYLTNLFINQINYLDDFIKKESI